MENSMLSVRLSVWCYSLRSFMRIFYFLCLNQPIIFRIWLLCHVNWRGMGERLNPSILTWKMRFRQSQVITRLVLVFFVEDRSNICEYDKKRFFFLNNMTMDDQRWKFSLFHKNSHVSISNPICFYLFCFFPKHSFIIFSIFSSLLRYFKGRKIVMTIEIDKWKFHMQMHVLNVFHFNVLYGFFRNETLRDISFHTFIKFIALSFLYFCFILFYLWMHLQEQHYIVIYFCVGDSQN